MLTFSANLGFLWTDRPLPDAIRAAKRAGFDAVECHAPYAFPASEVRAALDETGLEMLSLNTRGGDEPGDLGVAAIPGRESEARRYIHEAIDYANEIGCAAVSVVAGRTGRTEDAELVYRTNLAYAAGTASTTDLTVLIEPLNSTMCDDYHLVSADRGAETIAAVGYQNLKLMIDYFHLSVMEAEPMAALERVLPLMGHFQFASIPDRAEPDQGTVDYGELLSWLVERGYQGHFSAEYNPASTVEAGLGWMATIRKGAS